MAINICVLAIFVMTILIWIAYFAGKTIVRLIVDLSKMVKVVGNGDLRVRVEVRTNDEIGILGDSFNKMTGDLQETTVLKDYVDNIIKSMSDTLIVLDCDAAIQTINQATFDLPGYREDELIN